MDAQNYKNLCPQVFNVCKILKMGAKKILKIREVFYYYCKRRCTIKNWNKRWVQSALNAKYFE